MKLLFATSRRATEVILSARAVQQGHNLGSLCYGDGSLKLLRVFRTDRTIPGAQALAFIDDITAILPSESACDTAGHVVTSRTPVS